MVWKPCTLTAFTGISRDSSENLSPTFPLTFSHSRDTGAHLLKLDIVSTVHCSQNTFNDTHLLAMWVWSLTQRDKHDEYVTVYTTQHNRVPMSGERNWMSFETYVYCFWVCICRNLYMSELLYDEVTGSQSAHMGHSRSSGSKIDPGPLNTLNTLYNGIHTTNTMFIQRYTP